MKIIITSRYVDMEKTYKLFSGFERLPEETVDSLSKQLKQENHKEERITAIYRYPNSDIYAILSNKNESLGYLDLNSIKEWITEGDPNEDYYMIIHANDVCEPLNKESDLWFSNSSDRTLFFRHSNPRIISFFQHECSNASAIEEWVKGIFVVDAYIENEELEWDDFLVMLKRVCSPEVYGYFAAKSARYFDEYQFENRY